MSVDDEKFMDDVMLVEPVPGGIRLLKLFEAEQVIPATIRQLDLMRNRVFLDTVKHKEIIKMNETDKLRC